MYYRAILLTLFVALAAGCGGPKSGRGFTLPDGDAKRGQEAFVKLQCHACHTVSGAELPKLAGDPERQVALGGEVTRLKTYGQLVTSIINPSHKIAKGYPKELVEKDGVSKMNSYNDVLTVTELIDLVAFLVEHYKLQEYVPTDYPMMAP